MFYYRQFLHIAKRERHTAEESEFALKLKIYKSLPVQAPGTKSSFMFSHTFLITDLIIAFHFIKITYSPLFLRDSYRVPAISVV